MTTTMLRLAAFAPFAVALAGCVPKATVLAGSAVAPTRLPSGLLVRAHQTIAFTWAYQDVELRAQGEGAARISAPDSARLDLFMSGGLGGGHAVILGDSLYLPPNGGMLKRFLPPVAMFWAAIGRLAVPQGDTTVRVDASRTHADIARGRETMRVTFEGDRLATLERISDGGIVERLTRGDARTEYEHLAARRKLTLVITRTTDAASFDAAIFEP